MTDKEKLELTKQILMEIRAIAKFEQEFPSGLVLTALSLIVNRCNEILEAKD